MPVPARMPGCAWCSPSSIPRGRRRRSRSRSTAAPGHAARRGPGRAARRGRPARRPAVLRRQRQLSDDAALGEPPLLDGAVLTVDRADLASRAGCSELHVVAGPDSGAVHRLAPGEHGVGRAAEASVRLDDPDVSRLHAVLRVATDGSGGSDGPRPRLHQRHRPSTASPWAARAGRSRPGDVLRVGASRLALALPELVPVSCRPDGAGHLEVNRPPRQPALDAPAAHRACRPSPPRASAARFPLWRSCCRWSPASRWSPSRRARPTCCSCCSRR